MLHLRMETIFVTVDFMLSKMEGCVYFFILASQRKTWPQLEASGSKPKSEGLCFATSFSIFNGKPFINSQRPWVSPQLSSLWNGCLRKPFGELQKLPPCSQLSGEVNKKGEPLHGIWKVGRLGTPLKVSSCRACGVRFGLGGCQPAPSLIFCQDRKRCAYISPSTWKEGMLRYTSGPGKSHV